jgi:hypothetical protein
MANVLNRLHLLIKLSVYRYAFKSPLTPLWQRGVRGDLLGQVLFVKNYGKLNSFG